MKSNNCRLCSHFIIHFVAQVWIPATMALIVRNLSSPRFFVIEHLT